MHEVVPVEDSRSQEGQDDAPIPPPQPLERRQLAMAFGREYFGALGATMKRRLDLSSAETNNSLEEAIEYRPQFVYEWSTPPSELPLPWHQDADKDNNVVQIEATSQSTVFLSTVGDVYQTGMMHGHLMKIPTFIPMYCLPTRSNMKIRQIATGRHFTLALVQDGSAVFSWGAGHFGQLGLSTMESEGSEAAAITYMETPTMIERLSSVTVRSDDNPYPAPHARSPIISIAAGDWHGLALTESGRVWCWGGNRHAQCGQRNSKPNPGSVASTSTSSSNSTPTVPLPLPVHNLPVICQITAGRSHSMALSRDLAGEIDLLSTTTVYVWGNSQWGQCGSLRKGPVTTPRVIEGLPPHSLKGTEIVQLAAGGHHCVALTNTGHVWTWGCNVEGQLGILERDTPSTSMAPLLALKPQLMTELDDVTVARVAAGPTYTLAVSSLGRVYAAGSNDVGQLGLAVPTVATNTTVGETGAKSTCLFDSQHIVRLPQQIASIESLFVTVPPACGPNHVWFLGHSRKQIEAQQSLKDSLLTNLSQHTYMKAKEEEKQDEGEFMPEASPQSAATPPDNRNIAVTATASSVSTTTPAAVSPLSPPTQSIRTVTSNSNDNEKAIQDEVFTFDEKIVVVSPSQAEGAVDGTSSSPEKSTTTTTTALDLSKSKESAEDTVVRRRPPQQDPPAMMAAELSSVSRKRPDHDSRVRPRQRTDAPGGPPSTSSGRSTGRPKRSKSSKSLNSRRPEEAAPGSKAETGVGSSAEIAENSEASYAANGNAGRISEELHLSPRPTGNHFRPAAAVGRFLRQRFSKNRSSHHAPEAGAPAATAPAPAPMVPPAPPLANAETDRRRRSSSAATRRPRNAKRNSM